MFSDFKPRLPWPAPRFGGPPKSTWPLPSSRRASRTPSRTTTRSRSTSWTHWSSCCWVIWPKATDKRSWPFAPLTCMRETWSPRWSCRRRRTAVSSCGSPSCGTGDFYYVLFLFSFCEVPNYTFDVFVYLWYLHNIT